MYLTSITFFFFVLSLVCVLVYCSVGTSVAPLVLFLAGSFVQLGPQSFGSPVVQSGPEGLVEERIVSWLQVELSAELLKRPQGLPARRRLHKAVKQGVGAAPLPRHLPVTHLIPTSSKHT